MFKVCANEYLFNSALPNVIWSVYSSSFPTEIPLDIVVIGPTEPRGSIVKCKIIGVLYLIDDFEQDDKLIAISSKSNLENINSIADLDNNYNGISKILEIWFTNYKKGGNIESKGYGNSINALNILADSRNHFSNQKSSSP